MAYRIELDPRALQELEKIDRQHQERIVSFLRTRLEPLEDQRSIGQPLKGHLRQLWKYRLGDFRLICDIQDDVIRILVLRIGHRREVYRR
ncbi:MAG: type II toxin-antitoxin system RelE/ParE family toxin [Deltaproteobacteria bacterium]|nr:type II toxin-antitoxin system RelE/ParE family toxin [Deltaproteobacteria bacterium]